MPLAERIRQRRRELGLSQEELARQLSVRQNVISRLEAGVVQNPNLRMLRRLARVLKMTADELIGMFDEDPDAALALAGASP